MARISRMTRLSAAAATMCAAQALLQVTVPLKQRIAVPSYMYPCHETVGGNAWEKCAWDVMNNATPPVDYAILNPDSGPGATLNPDYVAQVNRSRQVGLGLLGYVYTQYGTRNISDVLGDIDAFYNWYQVDGIFLDEASNDCDTIAFYAELFNYTRAKPSGRNNTVVINPGTNTQPCFGDVADIIVNFEGSFDAYQSWQPTTWELSAPAARFWHIIFAADGDSGENAVAVKLSKSRNAGWLYITNQTLPNPYGALPGMVYFGDVIRWASNEI